jgi:serine/threonine protein kinase
VHKETGFEIAIKIIKDGGKDPDIKREIELMRQLRNTNTVSYYGIYERGDDIWSMFKSNSVCTHSLADSRLCACMCVVMLEYCSLGSIRDIIETCDIVLNEEQIAVVCLNTLKVCCGC